jgi:uncharacterized OB-fold protein
MEASALAPVRRDDESAAFFDGAAAGRLLVRRCRSGHYLGPSVRMGGLSLICPVCGTGELDWAEASGRAKLVSWTVGYERDGSPTGVAGIVELEEGAWLYALLQVAPDAELSVGQPLVAGFVSSGEGGETIPVFGPA